ncbi:MAG TPA: hypothetical protein VGB83_09610 [Actinomycetota bacterium]
MEPSERRLLVWLFVASAAALLTVQAGAITVSDGFVMYRTTEVMVEHGTFDLAQPVEDQSGPTELGRHGQAVSKYGIGLPLVSIPFYVVAKPLAKAGPGGSEDKVYQAVVASAMPLICAALVVALYVFARRLGSGRRWALLASAGGFAGTFLLPYSKSFFSEPLVALGLVVAFERALARRPGWSALGLAVAIVTRPQSLVLLPLLAFVWWRRNGARGLVGASAPLAAAAAIVAFYNWARFGSILEFGYGGEGFTTPLLTGARGLLIDHRASVLLFAPVLAVAPWALARLWRRDADAAVLLAGNFVVTFVMTATWWSWAGGWSWGPRLLIPAVAPLIPAVAPWAQERARRGRAVAALLAIGFVVSAPAMLVSQRAQQLDGSPVGPAVVRQYELIGSTTSRTLRDVSARADGDSRRYLDLWQFNAAAVGGAPGALGAVAGTLVLASLSLFAGRAAVRALRAGGDSVV